MSLRIVNKKLGGGGKGACENIFIAQIWGIGGLKMATHASNTNLNLSPTYSFGGVRCYRNAVVIIVIIIIY